MESNREHGKGRADLVIRDRNNCRVMIIEAKRAEAESRLQAECRNALRQIDDKQYTVEFTKGYKSVISYGIAFFDKKCLVMKSDMKSTVDE